MKITATIYQRQEIIEAGVVSVDFPVSPGTAAGVMLPTGGELAQRIYGVVVPVEFTFFTKTRNAGILEGNRLEIASVQYEILYIADYQKIQSVLLKKVI